MRALVWAGSLAVLLAAALVVPIPLVVLEPGPTFPVSELVEMAEGDETAADDLLATSVRPREGTVVTSVQGWISDELGVVPSVAIAPPGVEPGEFEQQQREVFTESVEVAAAVGLSEAGLDVEVSGDGVQVEAVLPDVPAAEALQEGDRIVGIGGEPVSLASELAARTARAEPGDRLQLRVVRAGEERQVEVEVVELSQVGRPGIGILASTVNQQISLPFEVAAAEALDVAGPSAGLMIALGVYDAVTEGDLGAGRLVAGTGSVDPTGAVGPVGGVPQKVQAAVRDGAVVFLVPIQEEEIARQAAPESLEVIGVESVAGALDAMGS